MIQQRGEFETDLAYYRSSRNGRGCGKHNQRDLLIKMSTTKVAQGLYAISTYTLDDGLGLNALSDSENYKKGIRENTTGRTRTLGMWQSCPDCSLQNKQQYFIPRDHKYELNEEIERKECPDPDYKSKSYSVFMAEKDIVLYPSSEPKREATYRVLTIDGKCSCGSDQGYSKEEWHFQPGTTWTPKKHNQKCPDCSKEYHINWTEEQRTYL